MVTTIFEKRRFLIRDWLNSMIPGEERLLPTSTVPYQNLKATCVAMKRLGRGEWKVTKKHLHDMTRVTRIS